jgi:hypothetical protein
VRQVWQRLLRSFITLSSPGSLVLDLGSN